MLATLALLALAIMPAPKTVVHVDVLDTQTVLVAYSDLSMAIAPFEAFRADGSIKDGYWFTTIDTTDRTRDLNSHYTDVNGMEHDVHTGCATLSSVDCALQHQKDLNAMLAIFPMKKPNALSNGGGDGGVINLPGGR
jgi:hypothetical protein